MKFRAPSVAGSKAGIIGAELISSSHRPEAGVRDRLRPMFEPAVSREFPVLVRYAGAMAVVAFAVLLRWLADPWLADRLPLVTLYGAVALSVWVGGYLPAALAMLVGVVACDLLFLEPRGLLWPLDPGNLIGVVIYVFSCVCIISLGEGMRVARRRVQAQSDALQRLIDVAPGAIWVARDAECRVIEGNRIAQSVYPAEAQARLLMRNAAGHLLDLDERPLQRAARDGVPTRDAELVFEVDGRQMRLLVSAVPLLGEDGEPSGAIAVGVDLTQRIDAERRHRETEQRLQLIADTLPALVAYVDREYRYRFNNASYQSMQGVDPLELQGKRLPDVLSEPDWAAIKPYADRALAGEPCSYETVIHFQSAGPRWVRGEYRPHFDADGRVLGFVALISDTTEQREESERLRRSEEAQRLFVAIEDAARGADAEAGIASIASEISRQFGGADCCYLPVDAHGVRSSAAIPADERSAAIGSALQRDELGLGRALRSGQLQVVFEGEWAGAPGASVCAELCEAGMVSLLLAPMLQRGVLVGVLALHTRTPTIWTEGDLELLMLVAERTRYALARAASEAALRESRDMQALAMRSGRMGAWSVDLITSELWCSDEFVDLVGLERSTSTEMAKLMRGRTEDADRRAFDLELAAAIAERRDFLVETRIHRPDGHLIWMELRGRPQFAADGTPAQVYGLGIDVTERKRANEELRRLNDDLSAEQGRKNEFLATLAHELRNPLAPIRYAVDLLRVNALADSPQQDAADMIDRQLRHLTELVDDLMDSSRFMRGKIELRRAMLDLGSLLGDAAAAVMPEIDRAGQHLLIDLPQRRLTIEADRTRIMQIVMNLLNNASKYSPGGASIRLSAAADEADPGQVRITVADNGVGIDAEHLEHIFDMFAQVVPALKRPEGGLGIGLALARGMAELHGGSIEAHSAGAGRGSEFVVRLPLAQLAQPKPAEPTVDFGSTAGRAGGARRILIVDDNPDAVLALGMMLETLGHEVTSAGDGQRAVQLAEKLRPELVLMDIGLPILNGYEAAEQIRAQPWSAKTTLVAITGWGQKEDRDRAEAAGFDHHLVKPVALERLMPLLETGPRDTPSASTVEP